jgi:hypothetical protein
MFYVSILRILQLWILNGIFSISKTAGRQLEQALKMLAVKKDFIVSLNLTIKKFSSMKSLKNR